MANMKIEARAALIAEPAKLLRELLDLEDGTVEDAIELVRRYTLLFQASELIPYAALAAAVVPHQLINDTAEQIKRAMALEILQTTGTVNLTKEGEWPS